MPGPIEPATQPPYPLATSLAICAALRLSSCERSAIPYSARVYDNEPNELVSTTSEPTSKNELWSWAMASGRVATSSSLHPSNCGPPKSSAVSSMRWRLVPVAPS